MATAILAITFSLCILAPTFTATQMLAVGAQPYMPSLFLVLLGHALLFRTAFRGWIRLLAAQFCMFVAFWLNMSIASIAIGMIVCLDHRRGQQWVNRFRALIILVCALCTEVWLANLYPKPTIVPHLWIFEGRRTWFHGLHSLCTTVAPAFFQVNRLWVLIALVLVVAGFQLRRGRIAQNYNLAEPAVFLSAAVTYALLMSKTEWVKIMGYNPRYWTIPVVILLLLVTGWVSAASVRLLCKGWATKDSVALHACGLLVSVILYIFGMPSYGKAKAYLAQNINRYDADERALGCTHIVGNYLIGWTSVFQRESSGGPPIFAITNRSDVTKDRWDWPPDRPRTYCGVPGLWDREGNWWLPWVKVYGLPPMRETVRSGTLCKLDVIVSSPFAGTLGSASPDTGKTVSVGE
jgi:hypothetical protein